MLSFQQKRILEREIMRWVQLYRRGIDSRYLIQQVIGALNFPVTSFQAFGMLGSLTSSKRITFISRQKGGPSIVA